MITINNDKVFNLDGAIRGMRNPLNSRDKSDSYYDENGKYILGENVLGLAKRLTKSGSDHRKYMRQIFVSVDITAPLYWWKEFDTYKVGTVANSCSTMHKIHEKEFMLDDFSHDHIGVHPKVEPETEYAWNWEYFLIETIRGLNAARSEYLRTKDKFYWWQMIQLLPSSYNQLRTVTMNYENLLNMYRARKAHKLDEWREFCKWIETLPYSELITGGKDDAVEE